MNFLIETRFDYVYLFSNVNGIEMNAFNVQYNVAINTLSTIVFTLTYQRNEFQNF